MQLNTVRKMLFGLYHTDFSYSMQTLTTLDLGYNQIGGQALKHMSDMLRLNAVRNVSFSLFYRNVFLFHIDTNDTQSLF